MGELFKDLVFWRKSYISVFQLCVWSGLLCCNSTIGAGVAQLLSCSVAHSINVFYQSLLSSEQCKQLGNYSEQLASLVKLTWLREGFKLIKQFLNEIDYF